jgi:hypothetical protein
VVTKISLKWEGCRKAIRDNSSKVFCPTHSLIVVLNSEPADEDMHLQFEGIMNASIKGRTDLLKSNPLSTTAGGNKTGSTNTSENSQRLFFNQSFKQRNLGFLHGGAPSNNTINTINDMLETSIDPSEWLKEVQRVKSQLKIPKTQGLLMQHGGDDVEEINQRRIQILEHTKVVREFASSNIPVMMEEFVATCEQQLVNIRKSEEKMSSRNSDLLEQIRSFQSNKKELLLELKSVAERNNHKLNTLELIE